MLEKNGALAPFVSAAMTARQAPSAQALSNPGATGWKGPMRTTLGELPQLISREALECDCRYRREGVANARHPRPGTQSISALPRRVECDASDGLRAVETEVSRPSQSHRNRALCS